MSAAVVAAPASRRHPLRRATLLAGAFLLAWPPGAHGAQEGRVTVRIDGRPVFRVGAVDSTTAAQRARRIERRLATLLETPRALAAPRVEPAGEGGDDRMLTVSGVPVVTVGTDDAEDNLTTVDALARQWAGIVEVELRRAADRRLSRWGRFGAEVNASIQAAFSRLAESAIRIVPRAIAALLVLALFWALATAVRRMLRVLFRRVIDDLTVENLVKQLAYYAVWIVGLIVTVDALGFQPQTVVTGLGLTGLALGFALKDIISNFVSGLLILSLRPFQLGDQIVVGETEGSVERIRLRATEIRTYDGRLVLVPNAEVFTSRVTNNTASPVRRAIVPLFLGYDADLSRAVATIAGATAATDGVLPEPPVAVRIAELGQDDLLLEARFWTDSRRSDFTATRAAVRAAIVGGLRDAGIGLPDPDVRRLVPHDPGRWRTALARGDGRPGDGARAYDQSRGDTPP